MKRINKFLLFLLMCSSYAWATSVTATLTDSDSQTWNKCTWRITLNNPRPDITPSVNGTPLTASQLTQTGTCSSSGVLTVTLVDNSTINIVGTTWTFQISPLASATGITTNTAVSGSSQSLSATLSAALIAPRFNAGPNSYGYLDVEVGATPLPGGTYYNVSTPAFRQWTGSAWTTIGTGSGSGVPSVNGITTAVTIAPGTNIGVTNGGSTITVAMPSYHNVVSVASCASANAMPLLSVFDFNTPFPGCLDGGTNVEGYLGFAQGGTSQLAQYSTWYPTTVSSVTFTFKFFTPATSGNVVYQVQATCMADGSNPSSPTFSTAATATTTAPGTANTIVTSPAATVTFPGGCAAGNEVRYQISRASTDSAAGQANLLTLQTLTTGTI